MHKKEKSNNSILKGIMNNSFVGPLIEKAVKRIFPNSNLEPEKVEIYNEQIPSKTINNPPGRSWFKVSI